jgi:hypothetical protein
VIVSEFSLLNRTTKDFNFVIGMRVSVTCRVVGQRFSLGRVLIYPILLYVKQLVNCTKKKKKKKKKEEDEEVT